MRFEIRKIQIELKIENCEDCEFRIANENAEEKL